MEKNWFYFCNAQKFEMRRNNVLAVQWIIFFFGRRLSIHRFFIVSTNKNKKKEFLLFLFLFYDCLPTFLFLFIFKKKSSFADQEIRRQQRCCCFYYISNSSSSSSPSILCCTENFLLKSSNVWNIKLIAACLNVQWMHFTNDRPYFNICECNVQ